MSRDAEVRGRLLIEVRVGRLIHSHRPMPERGLLFTITPSAERLLQVR